MLSSLITFGTAAVILASSTSAATVLDLTANVTAVETLLEDSVDYVVVGGGNAGLAVAARLAASKKNYNVVVVSFISLPSLELDVFQADLNLISFFHPILFMIPHLYSSKQVNTIQQTTEFSFLVSRVRHWRPKSTGLSQQSHKNMPMVDQSSLLAARSWEDPQRSISSSTLDRMLLISTSGRLSETKDGIGMVFCLTSRR